MKRIFLRMIDSCSQQRPQPESSKNFLPRLLVQTRRTLALLLIWLRRRETWPQASYENVLFAFFWYLFYRLLWNSIFLTLDSKCKYSRGRGRRTGRNALKLSSKLDTEKKKKKKKNWVTCFRLSAALTRHVGDYGSRTPLVCLCHSTITASGGVWGRLIRAAQKDTTGVCVRQPARARSR